MSSPLIRIECTTTDKMKLNSSAESNLCLCDNYSHFPFKASRTVISVTEILLNANSLSKNSMEVSVFQSGYK